jgi:hypothetical protein
MILNNNGKNPNELHDFLIANGCTPLSLMHNAVYNDKGEKVTEATEIQIEVEEGKENLLDQLVGQFMAE